MFTTLTPYRITADLPPTATALDEALARGTFAPCAPSQFISFGWAPPRGPEHGRLLEPTAGQWIACLQIEERILPGAYVKRVVETQAAKLEEETGRKPRGKALKAIKEEVVAQLLPRAFTRLSRVLVWIDPRTRLVCIGAAGKKADTAAAALAEVWPDMNLARLMTQHDPEGVMTAWVSNQDAYGQITIGTGAKLQGQGEQAPCVTIQDDDLGSEQVAEYLAQGMRVQQLDLAHGATCTFTLAATSLKLSRIEMVGDVHRAPQEGEDRFDADVAISAGTLAPLLADLIESFGGLSDLPILEEASKPQADAEDAEWVEA
jgi:recombination associated protein RdgC